jgi:hypothetical protein
MEFSSIENEEKIVEVIRLLISRNTDIKVRIKGEKIPFTSRIVHLNPEHNAEQTPNGPEEKPRLVIEKLTPDKGNTLIQSSQDIVVEFNVDNRSFQFDGRYTGTSTTPPHFGIMMDFPELLRVRETRRENRIVIEVPEFVSVEFKSEGQDKNDKMYELKAVDYSKHGLGLLVTENNSELLEILKPGDKIQNMTFFARRTLIKVDAKVIHITKIQEGKDRGKYIIGLESEEIIESSKPPT